MNIEKSKELKQLLLNEMAFRNEFREKRKELEALVSPISKHVKDCCKFWAQNLPNVEEIIIMMDNGTSLKLVKPKLEDCSVESYLPFGIDFSECEVINIGSGSEQ